MDVTQSFIKINQTNQSNGGTQKPILQSDGPVNSFEQILAMFYSLGQPSELKPKVDDSSKDNLFDEKGYEQINLHNSSEQDLSNLDTILSSLILVIQQLQNSPLSTQGMPMDNSLTNESHLPVDFNLLNPFQQKAADVGKALEQLLQKTEGIDKSSTMDSSGLLQKLAELLNELPLQEKPKSLEIPKEIGDKIHTVFDGLKIEPKSSNIAPLNGQLGEGVLPENNKQDPKLDSKQALSLDKNQLFFTSTLFQGKRGLEGNKMNRLQLSSGPKEDLIKSSDLVLRGSYQLQGPNTNSWSQTPPTQLPTNLSVSEFVPEVSEWIGRYMMTANNQTGSAEAKFSLYPEHLGHIEIKITSHQGEIAAQILTDTSQAKEVLEGQLQHLRQALQQHGLLIQKLDIVQQTSVTFHSTQANLSFSQGDSNSSQDQRSNAYKEEVQQKQFEADSNGIEIDPISTTYGGVSPKTASFIDFTA